MIAETTTMPSRKYLEELTVRLDTITRFMESQGNSDGCRDEALSIANAMVSRAIQLRDALGVCKGTHQTLNLDQLRDALSGMSLAANIAEYDRALTGLQNAIGDEVYEYESSTQTPDNAGRDTLDALEAIHLQLHNVMRELVGATAI
jgi:hypothetical protein